MVARKGEMGKGQWRENVLPRQRLQNRRLLLMCIADAQIEHLIEAPRPEQRLVQQVRTIRRSNHKHAPATLLPIAHPVQLRQQLRDDAVHDPAAVALVPALRGHGVQLVEEDDAGSCITRALEDSADVGF